MNKKLSKSTIYYLNQDLDKIKESSRLQRTFNKKFENNLLIFQTLSKVTPPQKDPYSVHCYYRYGIADNTMFTMFIYPGQHDFKGNCVCFSLLRDWDEFNDEGLTKDGFPQKAYFFMINRKDYYFIILIFGKETITFKLYKEDLGDTFSKQLFNIFVKVCYECQKAFLKDLKKED